jgi:hypothetical protein
MTQTRPGPWSAGAWANPPTPLLLLPRPRSLPCRPLCRRHPSPRSSRLSYHLRVCRLQVRACDRCCRWATHRPPQSGTVPLRSPPFLCLFNRAERTSAFFCFFWVVDPGQNAARTADAKGAAGGVDDPRAECPTLLRYKLGNQYRAFTGGPR